MKNKWHVWLLTCLILGCAVVIGGLITLRLRCGDYAIRLQGNYELVRTNASSIMIWRIKNGESECVVPPTITRIGGNGNIIYGFVKNDPDSDSGYKKAKGYWI